ncbi:DUF6527 family protein [Ensifer aridi]|uniref:DUF6527 family protein n=1 Tax=Ensifer aridi TaxID=1708715 RepID=UPI0009BE025F
MIRAEPMRHKFVDAFPERLERGVLYVALDFATMSHLCACGCGTEVVTPLSPLDWRLTFDGVTITINPSIGNWSLPCRSHYVIKQGVIHWAGDWSDEQIAEGRRRDLLAKRQEQAPSSSPNPIPAPATRRGILRRLRNWLKKFSAYSIAG